MPKITGILHRTWPRHSREIKLQPAAERTSESKPIANPTRPEEGETVARDEQVSRFEPAKKSTSVATDKPILPFQARLNYDIENEDSISRLSAGALERCSSGCHRKMPLIRY